MSSTPDDETRQRVSRVLEDELAEIDSPEAARQVAQRLRERAAGETEHSRGEQAEQAAPDAADAVEQAARGPDRADRVAGALLETAAQAVSDRPEAGAVVDAAQEAAGTKPATERQGQARAGQELLERAVIEELPPLDSLDARLFLAANHLPHPRWLDRVVDVVAITTGGGWIWAAGVLVARLLGVRGTGRALGILIPSLVGTNLIVEGPVKAYFRRRRPFIDVVRAVVVGKKPGNWSFPSGHTASSFAAARMVACIWPRSWPAFYAAAVLVGFSRMYTGSHYPTDVMSGAVVGSVLAEVIRRTMRRLFGWRP